MYWRVIRLFKRAKVSSTLTELSSIRSSDVIYEYIHLRDVGKFCKEGGIRRGRTLLKLGSVAGLGEGLLVWRGILGKLGRLLEPLKMTRVT
jgi:hypothetical protein